MNNLLNVIDTFSPVITFIASTVASCIVSKLQSRHEIKKTLLSFDHEDKQSFEKALADVLAKSGMYTRSLSIDVLNDAISSCAAFSSICPKEFVETIIELDEAIRYRNVEKIEKMRIALIQINSNTK